MLDDFIVLMRRGIHKSVPSLKTRCNQRRGPRRASPALRRLRMIREATEAVRHSVRLVRSGARSASGKVHRRAVGALQDAAGVYAGVPHTDLDGLVSLCDEVRGADDSLLEEMVATWRRAPTADGQHWRHLSSTHANPAKLGRFITAYLRPAPSAALDRAVRPSDGQTVWDPEEYKPLVRAVVSAPLSKGAMLGPPFPSRGRTLGYMFYSPDVLPALAPPFRSTDAAGRSTRPFWWDQMYARDAKGIPDGVFASVCDPPPPSEVAAVIRGCPGGKAPGHDGLGIDFWKLVASEDDSPCLRVLTRLIGMCMSLGVQPDALKHGWITMVPKVKPDGSFCCSADGMRPITLLPEVGKIASRILAKRIGDIFVQQPRLLCEAQRGFLADGSVLQCADSLIDVVEDWKQKRRDLGADKAGPLYVLSYDQSKAYDSVQAFTIRASLERFNFPEIFIKYVLSGLHGATSRVRTKDGLTKPFGLSTGVRQGDPLSPIIYILTQDALHAGLRDNPLYPARSKDWGYTFRSPDPDTGDAVRVCSAGYADDTAMVATSLGSVTRMHAWVREFFGANRAALNCSKSHLLCSDGAAVPILASVDGQTVIEPRGEAHTIRYLGVWLNLRLDWAVHIARMDRLVWSVASSIRRGGFDLVMSKTAVNQFLMPGLRVGLLVTDVPDRAVKCWDARIRQAVLCAAGVTMRRCLSVEAFYNALLFPRIADQRWALRGEEHMVTVIAQYPSSRSCRARMATRKAGPRSCRALRTRTKLGRDVEAVFMERGRVGPVLRSQDPSPWNPEDNVWSEWTPYLPTRVRSVGGAASRSMHARVYTDGSTGPTPGAPSGCSVVVVLCGAVVNVHGFPCRASGNNYLSEMVALLAALQAVPSNVPLTVHSDCLAGIFSANKRRCRDWARGEFLDEYALPQRRRILSAARPVLNGIRAVIRCRAAPTRLEFVRAHTGASNQHALMNQRADEEANRARRANADAKLALHLYGEERHSMALRRIPVIGAFKPAILRYMSTRSISRWCEIPSNSPVVGTDLPPLCPAVAHSARLVSAHSAAVIAMSGTVSRTRDPQLLRFWLLAVTEWLPVERRLVRSHRAGMPSRGHGCKLCGAPVETVRHVFVCPRRELTCERDNSIGCALRVLAVAGIRSRSGIQVHPAPPVHVTVDAAECDVRWVQAWFDLSGRSWLEVCVFSDSHTTGATAVDALAAVLGVMPKNVSALFAHERLPSGAWRRRSLRDVSALVASLQEELLRGSLGLWKARCRTADAWWRSPAAEPAVRARASQVREGRDRDSSYLAQVAEKRRHSAYIIRMAKKKAKREAKSPGPLTPLRRSSPPTSELSPGEPDPVDRPGDWLAWKTALLVAAGSGRVSVAQGFSLANSCHMARIAEVTGSVRSRTQADHGPHMVSQGEFPDPVSAGRSAALPWF